MPHRHLPLLRRDPRQLGQQHRQQLRPGKLPLAAIGPVAHLRARQPRRRHLHRVEKHVLRLGLGERGGERQADEALEVGDGVFGVLHGEVERGLAEVALLGLEGEHGGRRPVGDVVDADVDAAAARDGDDGVAVAEVDADDGHGGWSIGGGRGRRRGSGWGEWWGRGKWSPL
mmetsp:Transcript_20497/g.54662  ORF Transcript_20497/g.54662 Transcript_20497/m.54662 type:complete len:172 (+) Transcript_20497:2309-2824(+)